MRSLILFSCFILLSFSLVHCTLEQIHVIFRHGDRTPDTHSYPTDPYMNETFYPIGRGQLTLLGKQQEFKIGQNLRKAYDNFLGKIYTDDVLEARSTDFIRTKMSLQLALAGLWPPTFKQKWNKALNWQPIPYIYDSLDTDKVLKNVFINQEVNEKYNEILQLDEVKQQLENFKWIFEIVNEHGGLNATRPVDLFTIYFTLYTQEKMGLILPEWTYTVFPEALEKAVVLDYQLKNYNSEMQQLSIGGLFSKIKHDIKSKMQGTSKRKLYLYSAHEYTVAFTLIGLDVFQYNPCVPSYGSYVTLELHKIDNKYGIQLFFNENDNDIPMPIVMPECEIFCPIDKFFNLIGHITTN